MNDLEGEFLLIIARMCLHNYFYIKLLKSGNIIISISGDEIKEKSDKKTYQHKLFFLFVKSLSHIRH